MMFREGVRAIKGRRSLVRAPKNDNSNAWHDVAIEQQSEGSHTMREQEKPLRALGEPPAGCMASYLSMQVTSSCGRGVVGRNRFSLRGAGYGPSSQGDTQISKRRTKSKI
ncbi:unnamed protein product [Ectocarpus fasciculatus]